MSVYSLTTRAKELLGRSIIELSTVNTVEAASIVRDAQSLLDQYAVEEDDEDDDDDDYDDDDDFYDTELEYDYEDDDDNDGDLDEGVLLSDGTVGLYDDDDDDDLDEGD
jgi:U3 small nucleolar RNA-associated protein MPP10